jgi:uncharacterized protein YceK
MGQSNGKIQTSIYLTAELNHGMRVAAATLDMPFSAIIEDLLVAHLDAYVAAKQAQKAKPQADQG